MATKKTFSFILFCCTSLIYLIALSNCGAQPPTGPDPNQVVVPSSDTTPPIATLDAYDIPLQPGATFQDNPETVNDSCCDVTRVLGPHSKITLLAGGNDNDGGVKDVWVAGGLDYECDSSTGGSQLVQEDLSQNSPDNHASKAGDIAQKSRVAQLVFSIDELRRQCFHLGAVAVTLCAGTMNFYHGTDQTKCFKLIYNGDPRRS